MVCTQKCPFTKKWTRGQAKRESLALLFGAMPPRSRCAVVPDAELPDGASQQEEAAPQAG